MTDVAHAEIWPADIEVIRKQLTEFIIGELSTNDLTSVAPAEDLIRQGLVDSAGVLQIVAFIEECYGASITSEEISVQNFRSVNSIARLVAQKRKNKK